MAERPFFQVRGLGSKNQGGDGLLCGKSANGACVIQGSEY